MRRSLFAAALLATACAPPLTVQHDAGTFEVRGDIPAGIDLDEVAQSLRPGAFAVVGSGDSELLTIIRSTERAGTTDFTATAAVCPDCNQGCGALTLRTIEVDLTPVGAGPFSPAITSELSSNNFFLPTTHAWTPQAGVAETVSITGNYGVCGAFSYIFDVDDVAPTGTPNVFFNEIHADVAPPSAGLDGDANCDSALSSTGDEFVEIVNTGTGAMNLSGATISDGFGVRFTFPSFSLGPDEAVVVWGGTVTSQCFVAPPSYLTEFTSGGLGLNNTGDTVTLVLADGITVVDTVNFGGGNDQSITLDPDLTGTAFVDHSTVPAAAGRRFSAGLRVDNSHLF